ncbi:MAG: TRAP transporter small permease [Candidatus Rokubacteria bacterium]|nr:TRAP transporter small permease [Candidatus Rokubacteria bacterium]
MSALWRWYDRTTIALLALSGAAMFAVVTVNVVLRYLFSSGLVWGEEAARYLMVWGVMLGIAVAYRARGHIAITMLIDTVPSRFARPAALACHALTLAAAAMLAFSGVVLTTFLGAIVAPATGLPMSWIYASVPVGAGLLFIDALRQLVDHLRGSTEKATSL